MDTQNSTAAHQKGHWTEAEIKAHQAATHIPEKIRRVLVAFPSLPNEAVIDDRVVGYLLPLSGKSIRSHPLLPPVFVSQKRRGRRVGDVRKLLAGEIAA